MHRSLSPSSRLAPLPKSLRKIAFTHGGTVFASKIAVINEDGTALTDLTAGGESEQKTVTDEHGFAQISVITDSARGIG